MDDESPLSQLAIEVGPDEMVSHVICIAVVTRPGTWDEDVRITSTAHTGRVLALGAVTEALEQLRMPDYEYEEDEDD